MDNTDAMELVKNASCIDSLKSLTHDSKLDGNACDNNSSESNDLLFYENAQKYWSEVPATVNGMLGGLGYISAVDIQGSQSFLRFLHALGNQVALDCGAGIGRVTKRLLMPLFAKVELVEQDSAFAKKAVEYTVTDEGSVLGYPDRLGRIFNVGLQQFTPDTGKYDLIWSQWVLGHLTDRDLVNFFRRVRNGLTKNGYFVIKENVNSCNSVEIDLKDSSVVRPLRVYKKFLQKCKFRIVREVQQHGFPKGLYPVFMIACRPQ